MIGSAALLGLFSLRLSLSAAPVDRLPAGKEVQIPEGGVSALDPNALFTGDLSNPQNLPVQIQPVIVKSRGFKKALEVTTEAPTSEWWAIQFVMDSTAPVQKGDALLASFYIRCMETKDETGEAYVRAVFQTEHPPYNKSLTAQVSASRQWRRIYCPFEAVESTEAGNSVFNFAFPTGPQRVQIAGLSLINYGTKVSDTDLPKTVITYDGREPDSPWRKAAQQRIDKFRKADLSVLVKDGQGKPVRNAKVLVNMTRHAFPFGAAVAVEGQDGRRFGGAYGKRHTFTEKDDQEYDYWLRRWFTKATPETALMPNGWTGTWNNLGREVAINGVKKYHALGYDIRGHILVWPGWKWFRLPGIEAIKNDPEKLGKMVLDHITDETSTLKPWVNEWTLLNEPFAHHDLMDVLGNQAMVDWFKAGHQANPDAKLYINDYSILSGGGLDLGHQDHYAKTIKYLLDNGAPLHGIGMQGHFGEDPTAPERVYKILERFAKFGKEMQITEFDVNTRDNELQADYTRDFMTICFSHPKIVAFSFWGFWENAHWRPDAAMIDKDWKLKPSGEAYEKLVLHEWWTQQEGATNKKGQYKVRGFLGDYQITVRAGAYTCERELTLKTGGTTLEVVLEPGRSTGENADNCRSDL
ncbi:MAG: endo-1,4-beta-xylanase [Candidatus Hydrogenedentes bacterium]|nr:endo-1,4-beta-xylanase [Candidatus Hydrogenedentota bacterium]